MPEQHTPAYRRQKRKGRPALAFVEINKARHYLGEYGTAESPQRYNAAVAEWKATGFLPAVLPADLRIVELIDRYWSHAQAYYRKPDGTPTSERQVGAAGTERARHPVPRPAGEGFRPAEAEGGPHEDAGRRVLMWNCSVI